MLKIIETTAIAAHTDEPERGAECAWFHVRMILGYLVK